MAQSQKLIKARERLEALYRQGVEVRFGGRYGPEGKIAEIPEGQKEGRFEEPLNEEAGELAMWVQPPSPVQRDMALRSSNAARARALLVAKNDEDSEEHLTAMEFIEDMSDETLYEYVLLAETDQRRQSALREVLGEEEWSDITELQDSLRVFEEENRPEDDPEVVAVRKREDELAKQVAERERTLRDADLDALKFGGRERAKKQALEKRSDIIGSQAFMKEYERQMSFYSVRDPENTAEYFFTNATELADQPDPVRNLIMEAQGKFLQDGAEAKNSPRAASGSTSSELPSKQETSESSTPEESIA